MFTFLSVISQNFEYSLRILANFRVKTKKSTDFACTFSRNYRFFFFGFFNKGYIFYTKNLIFNFLIKILLFTVKIYFLQRKCPKYRKNQFFSNIFTFLSVIRQNFEYNLRILANFRVKSQKPTDFAHTFSKNYSFWGGFFNKDYTFYTENLFFYNERCPKFCKNQFFSNMFTFLSVISQNFEYSLRILANFRVKTQKSTDFARTFSRNYRFFFFGFFNKGYIFYTKNLFFTTKDAQSIVTIRFLVTCLYF